MKDTFRHFEMNHALQCVFPPMQYFACNCESYQESIGKGDKIGNEAYRWASARVFNSNKTSVGKAIAFGCATRCHLSLHSLAMPRSGSGDASRLVSVSRFRRFQNKNRYQNH